MKSNLCHRRVSLVVAFILSVVLNSAVAQRISGSGGIYTIDNTGTNTGTNFTSFTEAINNLNTVTLFTGNITINVTAGQVFVENTPVITATGNSSAGITFIKSGSGTNPLISANGNTSFEGDAAITIKGGDYFTFNGINITAADPSLEYGYLICKASFDNAARHNTITNCTVLMSRVKAYSYAILQSSDSIITNLPIPFNISTNPIAQTNNNNTYTNITIGNAYNAIWLNGISPSYRDSNNVCNANIIGRSGFTNDLGATTGTIACYGVYASNQFTFQGSNNIVRNIVSTGPIYPIYTIGSVNVLHNNNELTAMDITTNQNYYIYGIYLNTVTTAQVNNNNIHDINAQGTSRNYMYGIYFATVASATANNNNVTNLTAYSNYVMATANIAGQACNAITFASNTISYCSSTGIGVLPYNMPFTTGSRLTSNTVSEINTIGVTNLFFVSGGNTDTIDNNTATNITAAGTINCINATTATSFRIYNNTAQNILSTGGGVNGIAVAAANNTDIYNNTILNAKSGAGGFASNGASYTGIVGGTCNIYNNTISDFGNTPTASGTGLICGTLFSHAASGTITVNYYNNVINGLTKTFTGTAVATQHLRGLSFATAGNATSTYNLTHNTVSIDGSSAPNSSSAVVYTAANSTSASPIVVFLNNIFANFTPTQTGLPKHYLFYCNAPSAGIIGGTGSSSDYNDWYLDNTSNGFFGYSGSDKADLTAWKATPGLTAYEANSITGNPLFNTPTNSRLLFGSPAVKSGLYISGFTHDILGEPRSLTTPSMGAYETPKDVTNPIITYTPALSIYSTSNYALPNFATITDGTRGAIPTSAGFAPRLYYKTKTNTNVFVGNTSTDNGWKYVEASNTTSPFSFTIDFSLLFGGSAIAADTIQYFVVATDTAALPNTSANPAIGFVGTGVSAITSAPTTPSYFVVFGAPAAYIAADVVQNNISRMGQGTTNNQIIRVKVTTAPTGVAAYVSQLDFTTLGGGNDSANIASAKVYYTGTSSTFSTNTLFGTKVFSPVITGPIGAFSVVGNTLCPNGDNYFWLVYDMRNNAVIGDSVDAELTSATYFGTVYPYSGGATAGNRKIRPDYCSAVYTNGCTSDYISRVRLAGTLDNSSGCTGPQTFYNAVNIPTLTRGLSYPLQVSYGADVAQYGSVWIDFNDDGDFADAGEYMGIQTPANAGGGGTGIFTLSIPCNASLGTIRMRIRAGDNTQSSSIQYCGLSGSNWGESEDYLIHIIENPITYISSTSIQKTGFVTPGTTDAPILRIPLKAIGCSIGLLTDMYFNSTGTTAPTDIISAKLYKTGNSSVFSTTNLIATIPTPSVSFAFTGLTDTLLSSTNDTNNYWLAFEISAGASLSNIIDAQIDSIGTLGSYHIPTVTNPSGNLHIALPMSYISASATQSSLTNITAGSSNNNIIGLQVTTSATGSPIDITSLDINTTGTDSLPDISDIKIWYTGTSSTFDTLNQFGTAITTPAIIQTVNGLQALANGTNYFWVTYSILSNATLGHVVDAELSNAVIGGIPRTPSTNAPTGNRQIKQTYCDASSSHVGFCTNRVQFNTLNLTSGNTCPALPSYTHYRDTSSAATTTVSKATIYTFIWTPATVNTAAGVWFDWNDDGVFSPAEFTQITANNAAVLSPISVPVAVPCSAITGKIRMRVRSNFYQFYVDNNNACAVLDYGETEDYDITITDNPIVYVSSSAVQTSTVVAPNSTNAPILRIPVRAKGCGVGLLTEMYFNTSGTTNATNIVSAKLYATQNSNTFNTNKLLGTVYSPSGSFSFTGLTDTLRSTTNDTNNYWLVYDLTWNAPYNNVVDARVDSINAVGVYSIPTNNNPAGNRQITAPMTYLSSTASHPILSKVYKTDSNNTIIKLNIVTSAVGSSIDLTSLDISTYGTDSLPDITNLKVWYTGASNVFATTSQFGSTITTPTAINTVLGAQPLANDTNNFWITYDISSNATNGHAIDAEATSATIFGITQTPTISAPVGNRLIRESYCNPVYSSGKTAGDLISNVSISGTTLSNNSGTAAINPAYTFFTGAPNLTAAMLQGSTYNLTVSIGSNANQGIAAWIDYNDDGVFSPSEKIGNTTALITTSMGSVTFPIILTCASVPGERRLRIRGVGSNPGATIDPCYSAGFGETEDYMITIVNNPIVYATSRVIQTTEVVAPGTNNAKLLRVPIKATGCGVSSISEFYFSTTGTTLTSDIAMAKLYATGNSSVFNTNNLLASTYSPNGQFVFNSFFDTLLVTSNDTNNYWLAYDISAGAAASNVVDATVDSILIIGSYIVPTNNNPAGNRQIISPMVYVSSTTTQPVQSKVGIGEPNNIIAGYEVVTSPTGAPIPVSSFNIATTGTTSLADITNLKVWYTGTNNIFAATTQFGTTIASPAATQTVTGSQDLANGTNYFWVTYDIAGGATVNNIVDAEISAVTIGAGLVSPNVSAPAGTRQIRNAYCTSNSSIPASYEDIGNITLFTAGSTVLNNGNAAPNLNNATATKGYTNFTALPGAQLFRNQDVDFSISIISLFANSYNDMAAIYIDYNQDGDFNEPNEMTWNSTLPLNANTGPFTGTFAVPNNASLGTTRMRVVLMGGTTTPPALSPFNSCGSYAEGETEDYTIEVNDLPTPSAYTWNKTGSANFNTASNWTPARTVKLGNDMLFVNGGGNITMTNVSNNLVKSLSVTNSTNLTLSGSSTIGVFDSLMIETGSSINLGNNNLVIGSDTSNIGIISGNGALSGRLKRWVNTTTTSYLFPNYVSGNNRSLNITYTTAPSTSGSLSLVYTPGTPGTGGLPITDANLSLALVNISNAGIWELTNTNGLVGGTYNMVANADGIMDAPVPNQTALVYRSNNIGSWTSLGTGTFTTGTSSALVLVRNGYTTYGQFGIAGTSSNPLPVKLTNFFAAAQAKDALLTWTIVSETNNRGFEIERSLDGRAFESVGFVKGADNSNLTVNYTYTDLAAFAKSGVWYYRLKQVDFDGKYSYSQIVKVSVNTNAVNAISVYPNPFKSEYTVSFGATQQGVAQLELVDIQGRVVTTTQLNVQTGSNEIPITETTTVQSGIYFLRINLNGESQTIKLVKE